MSARETIGDRRATATASQPPTPSRSAGAAPSSASAAPTTCSACRRIATMRSRRHGARRAAALLGPHALVQRHTALAASATAASSSASSAGWEGPACTARRSSASPAVRALPATKPALGGAAAVRSRRSCSCSASARYRLPALGRNRCHMCAVTSSACAAHHSGAPRVKPARVARRGEKLDEGVLYDGKRGPRIGEQLVLVYARQHCALGRDLPPAGGRRPRPRRLPIAGHDRTAEIIDAWRERRDSAGSLRIDRGKVERLGPPGPGTSLNAL